ncbi:MAG: hypothetical protein ACJ71D_08210 [Nitrososphaera sp.]
MVLRAKAAIIIAVIVLFILVTIIGFIIRLLAPIFVGMMILIILVVGGAWLYTNFVYVSSSAAVMLLQTVPFQMRL